MKFLFHELTVYYQIRKYLLIMRLISFLLLLGFLHATASGFTQTVSLSVSNMPLDKVCNEIEKQIDFYFVYTKDIKDKKYFISLKITHVTLDEALRQVFKGLPFTWTIFDKVVVINSIKNNSNSKAVSVDSDLTEIRGKVTNGKGEPLENASIVCKRSKKGTYTDENGEFKLKEISSDEIITISYTGFKSTNIKLVEGKVIYAIILDISEDELDKTVVQGYGMTSRRLTTGNIGVVSSDEIEKQPIMNPLQALQGRVTGLVVSQNNGYSSAPFKVTIRGINSVNPTISTEPLYIIDGVPLMILGVGSTRQNAYGSSFLQNDPMSDPANGQSPFFNINPSDIESITILKDADATAIYGSRGSNGVILITTKKGKPGKTQLNLNVYEGVSFVTRYWDMLTTKEYLQMRREALKNDGIVPSITNAPDLVLWDSSRDTNWQKYLWGGQGKTTNVQSVLSGGDTRTTFRISAGYQRVTDILAASGANQRATIGFNIAHHSFNQRLSVTLSGAYSLSHINEIFVPNATTLPPNAPPVFDKSGNLNYIQWDASPNVSFQFGNLLVPYNSQTGFLNSNLNLNYQVLKGLLFKVGFGYNNAQTNNNVYTYIKSQDPKLNPNGMAQFGFNRNSNWIIEPQVEYSRFLSNGKFDFLLGSSVQGTTTEGLFLLGKGYTNDALIKTISNAVTVLSTDNFGQYKYGSIFGRINYNWENKYILNIAARRDGSSRFGPSKQFGNFWSVGVAWIASEENWLRQSLPPFISFIKLRTSYGTTGSDAIGDYAYLTRWSSNGLLPYDGGSPMVPLQHTNPLYHWPTNRKAELALNLGFLKDFINLEFALYRNRCDDQLVQFPTPVYTGFSYITAANSPANVQNKGIELLLNAKIVSNKKITWSINFNASVNRNKLLKYPGLSQSPYANTYVVGQSLSTVFKLHENGVNPLTGEYSFQDKNHDGRITYNPSNHMTDDSYIYDLAPKFTGGLGNDLRYKGWSVSLFFVFVKQIGINALNGGATPPGGIANTSEYIYKNRWRAPGDIKSVARFTTITNNPSSDVNFYSYSNGTYTDASFIRLSNLSFSYSLSEVMVKKMGMQNFKVFVNAENILVFTRYKGIDPETQNFGGMPPAKIFTAGISCFF